MSRKKPRLQMQRRETYAELEHRVTVANARRVVPVIEKITAMIFARMRLDQIMEGVQVAAYGYSDHDLGEFLDDKPAELAAQLMRCLQAFDNADQSLVASEPAVISGVQAVTEVIQAYLKTGDRAELRRFVWGRADGLGALAQRQFSSDGNLRRNRDEPDEGAWIGEQLLALEATHNSRDAVKILIQDLEAEHDVEGALTPIKAAALLLLSDWLGQNDSTFRSYVKRSKDRAKARHPNLQR